MDKIPIPEPLVFNPLKHYLPFIRDFISDNILNTVAIDQTKFIRELKHLGTSVMDVYTGNLSQSAIFNEVLEFLSLRVLDSKDKFATWVGTGYNNFKVTSISDGSIWTLKFNEDKKRFVHLFPARSGPYTFRVKANTLKSAILYLVLIGKDYVTEEDLNKARALMGLPPVKVITDTEAVTEMIEVLRS